MSRYCTIARYKYYLDNVKNVKEISSRNILHIQDVINLGNSNRMYSSGVWNKIMKSLTEASKLQKTTEAVSAFSKETESQNVAIQNPESTRVRLFKKEFQKACSTVQKKLINGKGILLCSASVAAVNPGSKDSLPAELTSQVASKSPDGVPVEAIPEPPVIPEAAKFVSGLTNKSLDVILVEPITKPHQVSQAEVLSEATITSDTIQVELIPENSPNLQAAEILPDEPTPEPPPSLEATELLQQEYISETPQTLEAAKLLSESDISSEGTSAETISGSSPELEAAGLPLKNTSALDGTPLEPIPEPPPIFEGAGEVINQVNALGEPTLASLGLGGYTPVGLVQNCLEHLHADFGVPWWGAIVIGTFVIRICLFPLVVIAQRNAAKMNNCLPQMQAIQMKLTEARQTGNALDAARYTQELMLFMKEKNLSPFKNMLVPLAQMPVFVSFFMALRQMSNVPVESLRTGGLWWFTDLTLPDQYFILPLITSATLFATIELGTDSAKLSSQNMFLMKYVLRGLPIVILPFTVNFPGAILCYWVSTNFISLVQVGILRLPRVREYFNIEQMSRFDPQALPIKPKGFREGLKESWTNIKITKELEDRRRLDAIQFSRAGKGPIQKTYKYDPTKVNEPGSAGAAPMSARKP
ncbi:unnamed protein product [Acanthoscelides obtectus]|uniref:Membrane insertase YidC/Oxa/ALB C-terminal domain-containing protein n=1 Tax=Acanthoscelides obtectus TaxID=200917 RepID=A0A9P0JJG1_ACAOB|nr:unnamed protein product [Acanthoscelides obtectus]CAK1639681.1 Mitochondrial inner membrane protein OXA1L [Acanthoscelides obtectus]